MTKPYARVTPIGYNTGKLTIGCAYVPQPKPMTDSELFVQGLVLGRRMPLEIRLRDAWLRFKSAVKISHETLHVTIVNKIKELKK